MKTLPMILLAGTISLAGTAWAVTPASLPTGASVVIGTATVNQAGSAMTVTNSNGAIINWNSFSVGAGNSVQFVQPSSSSKVMNRVLGSDPSQIYGSVTSNGQVFLINPNGITVGPSGSINASGIFLSTANIADADFLAGNLQFEAPPAATPIVISGSLTATDRIYMRASFMDSSTGTLNAPSIDIGDGSAFIGAIDGSLIAGTGGTIIPGGGSITLDGGSIIAGGTVTSASGSITLPGGTATSTGGSITLPGGSATVAGGTASFNQTGNVITVTNTDATIINWNSFSIGTAGTINFVQPSASSVVLNRVLGDPRAIIGTLRSNGRVWLVNPSGIIVGRGGRINTAALAATRLVTVPAVQTAPPVATTTSLPARGAIRLNTGGMVDGAVTVRMSLVDASPISLR